LNTKLLEIIKIQTFYIDHFSIWESLSKQYSLNLESHINYMKLYVRIVDFQLHLPNILSNTKMVCILNVELDEWNNIGIHDFSSQDHLVFWKRCVAMNCFEIQNWVLQTWSNDPFDNFKWNNFEYKVVRDLQYIHPRRVLVKLGQMTN
jgi:hypothetical protein